MYLQSPYASRCLLSTRHIEEPNIPSLVFFPDQLRGIWSGPTTAQINQVLNMGRYRGSAQSGGIQANPLTAQDTSPKARILSRHGAYPAR